MPSALPVPARVLPGQALRVRILGFSPTERIALATIFEYSDQRAQRYTLAARGEACDLLLVDTDDPRAIAAYLADRGVARLGTVVVGDGAVPGVPPRVARPLVWSAVFAALDGTARRSNLLPAVIAGLPSAVRAALPRADGPIARVLVADADAANAEFIRAALTPFRIDTGFAPHAAQAFDMLGLTHYRLLFAADDLPGGGLRLLRHARRVGAGDTAIALMTRHDNLGVRLRAFIARCDAMLVKPVDPTELVTTLGQALSRGRVAPLG
ncbi:response regulator [Derxia lacustris]|uniref:response regulator n=1 Tax=Derxia lacustris TaxID=764842 RepID=UPI00111C050B|nr:response regulator [Derxia lacustris]